MTNPIPSPSPDDLPPPTLAQATPAEYEFSPEENAIIDSLTQGILWVRVPLVVLAVFQATMAVLLAVQVHLNGVGYASILGHILAAVFCFLLAGWLQRTAVAFTRVTNSRGRDITNLLTGIRNLALWFGLLGWVVKVYLILLVILAICLAVGLFIGNGAVP